MKITIFYSWQDTTERKFNRYFIHFCIKKAINKLEQTPEFKGVEFDLQEAVRDEPGSPPVASTIIDNRIPNADIFIADLSVVNHVNISIKWLQNLIGSKFKAFQNNNVVSEHGVALNALGTEKIIGVSNSAYGSPHDDPQYIFFDARHLRFPIGYRYTKFTLDKKKIENDLVNDLTNALRTTSKFALQSQKDKYKPLIPWSEWEIMDAPSQKYFTNSKIEELKDVIIKGVENPKQSIRIIGLSGLGKTRILLEIFRPDSSQSPSALLSSRVLYINCNLFPNADFQAIFTKLNSEGEDRIVILDNCLAALHTQLLHFIKREKNKVSFISVDSNPEEAEHDKINGVNYFVIKKEDLSSVVDDILSSDFSNLEKGSQERIKEFSQGIPLMAVLLGESVKNGEQFIGRLDNKELLDKLLGPQGKDIISRTILKSCSIFSYFGFTGTFESQLKFIATNKNITSISGDDTVIINNFHETCNYYLKREIFEPKGRMLGMRPFPLAISLAQEWLDPCTPDRLINVITDIAKLSEPDRQNLSNAFAEQMKYLGYDAKAQSIIDKIVGPNSPFDNAEVLNTELGSRLFRSFVEVNPVAIAQNFNRVFSTKTTDQLLTIEEGRRNLVWVLEKLCFDKRTFHDGVKILYAFAVAENETWANNATGQLIGLFHIILPGTEASLNDRWEIIVWGLAQTEKRYYELAISAMQSGLNYGHFHRSGGAEQQGSKRLEDFRPNHNEIAEYWTNILNKLVEISKLNNEYSDLAAGAVAKKIRMLCNAGYAMIILPFVRDISKFKNYDWDEGLEGLKYTRKYEKGRMADSQWNEVEELIKILTKTDFATRYTTLARSYHLDNDESYSSEKVKEAMEALADEFIQGNESWEELFPFFHKDQQLYSYAFGKRLYELLKDDKQKVEYFIDLSLQVLAAIKREERNVSVLGGFIYESNHEVKDKFYSKLFQSEDLNYLLFNFISNDHAGKKYFDLLFKLIDSKKLALSNFDVFGYSNALSSLSLNELEIFSKRLFDYGDEGYEIIFESFYNLIYRNEKLKETLKPIFKECILRLGVNKKEKRQLDSYKWSELICYILSYNEETEFAIFINNSVINSIEVHNLYHLDFEIQKIYDVLMKIHFNVIWKDLSDALLSKEDKYITFYALKHILGSHIGGVGRTVGVLFDGDIEAIFKWCEKEKPLAPARLAELIPIFDNDNSDYSKWHPIARQLIDGYGDIEDVLQGLNSNMGTYSWVGSVVPLLEGKAELFKVLTTHKFKSVENWAKSNLAYLEKYIQDEKNRDAEMYLH